MKYDAARRCVPRCVMLPRDEARRLCGNVDISLSLYIYICIVCLSLSLYVSPLSLYICIHNYCHGGIRYKTPDGKPLNAFGFDEKVLDAKAAIEVIEDMGD